MADNDGTLEIRGDVPALLKDVDEMVAQTQSRFGKLAKFISGVFSGITTHSSSTSNWNQTPIARTTKELQEQAKVSRDRLKIERDIRDVQRAARIERSRATYGQDAELTEQGDLRRQRRGRAIANIATGVNSVNGLVNSGFNSGAMVQTAGSIAGMLMPEFKPVIDALSDVISGGFKKRDMFREQALRRYQAGGGTGLNIDEGNVSGVGGAFGTNSKDVFKKLISLGMSPSDAAEMATSGNTSMDVFRKSLGFDISSFSSMYSRGARAGAFDEGGGDQQRTMVRMMQSEAAFGMGSNVTNLFGAARKNNASGDNEKALGSAFGLAMQEGLSRARFGEVVDQLTSAIEENTKGQADMGGIADRMLFISQLGGQYKGNTAASREMNSAIGGLGQGNTPYTQMAMLRAGGFGQPGVSYMQAWLKGQAGLDVSGGIKSEDIIKTNFGSYIPAYRKGNAQTKASIIYTIAQLTKMNGARIKDIMDRLASGPLGHVDSAAGMQRFTDQATPPRALIMPRLEKAMGEDSLRFGIGQVDQSEIDRGGGGMPSFMKKIFAMKSGGSNNLPQSFINSWVNQESGGDIQSRDIGKGTEDWRGARGYGQITREEAKRLGITSEDDFRRLSTDPEYSMNASKRLMRMKFDEASGTAKTFGLNWNKEDMLHLTKYEHGGSGYVTGGLSQFVSSQRRKPKSWEDYYSTMNGKLEGPDAEYKKQAQRALDNANKINVHISVSDKTSDGVDVKQETADFKHDAQRPASGEAPATTNR